MGGFLGLIIYSMFVFCYWKKKNPTLITKAVLLTPFLFVLALQLLIKPFLIEPVRLVDASMEPSFYSKDKVIIIKIPTMYSRGDVVLFKSSENQRLIKRIVGLPGEQIVLKNSKVYINGSELNEPYLKSGTLTDAREYLKESYELTIPANEYFVLGDNRAESKFDSRELGTITKKTLLGKIWFRYKYP